MGLKVAVAGKGGAGKTTVSAVLAGVLSRTGRRVLAVDLDPDPNLAAALGLPADAASPLVHRRDLVDGRTGSTGEPGGMFVLNPGVSDIADRYALRCTDTLHLLPVGAIETAGEGCFCPQAAFVKALVRRLVLHEEEVLVLDLEAGLESFGRAVVEGLDLLLVVVEPGMRSLDTARRILSMAASLGVRNIRVVANKVREETLEPLRGRMAEAGIPLDVVLPYRDELARRDLEGAEVSGFRDPLFEREILRACGVAGQDGRRART